MLVQADLRQFPAHSERHEKHAQHVVIEVAHAGCLRRRDAARPCEAAVPCISVICTTAARASGPARTATIVALCAGWYIYEIGALPEKKHRTPGDQVIREDPAVRRSVAGAPKHRQRFLSPTCRNAGLQQWYGGDPKCSRRQPNGRLRPAKRPPPPIRLHTIRRRKASGERVG